MSFELPEHMKNKECGRCGGNIEVKIYGVVGHGSVAFLCKKCVKELEGTESERSEEP